MVLLGICADRAIKWRVGKAQFLGLALVSFRRIYGSRACAFSRVGRKVSLLGLRKESRDCGLRAGFKIHSGGRWEVGYSNFSYPRSVSQGPRSAAAVANSSQRLLYGLLACPRTH